MSMARGRGYSGRNKDLTKKPGHSENEDSKQMKPEETSLNMSSSIPEFPKQSNDAEFVKQNISPEDEASLNDLLHIDDAHVPLILMLESFKPGEDGIAFNNRLREFENLLMSSCADERSLAAAFGSIGACALGHAAAARQLALTGAALSRIPSNNVTPLRTALLNLMQAIFMRVELMERCAPDILVNAVNLMGDYFAEARLSTGGRVSVLSRPLVRYLLALLKVGSVKAHRTMATQLMLNGRELLVNSRSELDDLAVAIKHEILQKPSTMPWLLLSADLCLNKFLPLPESLQQFYAKHLDLVPEAEEGYTEVAYGSWRNSPEKLENDAAPVTSDEPRKPRPILGMGARNQASNRSSEYLHNTSQECYGDRSQEFQVNDWKGDNARLDKSVNSEGYQKSALAKRYDLNSWRQQQGGGGGEQEDKSHISRIIESAVDCKPFVPQTSDCDEWQEARGRLSETRNRQSENERIRERLSDNDRLRERTSDTDRLRERTSDNDRLRERTSDTDWIRERLSDDRGRDVVRGDGDRHRDWNQCDRRRSLDAEGDKWRPEGDCRRSDGEHDRRSDSHSRRRENAPPPRQPSEVPRSARYWGHDDRCDKDYD